MYVWQFFPCCTQEPGVFLAHSTVASGKSDRRTLPNLGRPQQIPESSTTQTPLETSAKVGKRTTQPTKKVTPCCVGRFSLFPFLGEKMDSQEERCTSYLVEKTRLWDKRLLSLWGGGGILPVRWACGLLLIHTMWTVYLGGHGT